MGEHSWVEVLLDVLLLQGLHHLLVGLVYLYQTLHLVLLLLLLQYRLLPQQLFGRLLRRQSSQLPAVGL